MAPQFTFGQDISNTLGRVIQSNNQTRMAARQLNRLLRNDAFSRKISELSTRIKQKRLELDEEAQEQKIINAAIQNEIDRKREERLQRESDARIKNLLREKSNGGSNRGAVITALQNLFPQGRQISEQLREAEKQFLDAEQDLALTEGADAKAAAMSSLIKARGNLSALKERNQALSETINKLLNELNIDIDVSDIFNPGEDNNKEEPEEQESAPLDDL